MNEIEQRRKRKEVERQAYRDGQWVGFLGGVLIGSLPALVPAFMETIRCFRNFF